MRSPEISIIHHAAVALLLLWILACVGWSHPFAFFVSFLYLYVVNERYSVRKKKKMQFEERKTANEKKLRVDSESVQWLNRVVERIWPICMEQIASQEFLLPIIPWFLDNYKPWTAKRAAVQQLYLGRSPPTFTDFRILHEPNGDDHMVMELSMDFLSAEDMIAVLGVQLRKRIGLGMSAKMHMTGMHVEGRVLVGMKFIQHWPFIGRLRICFVKPPYFQTTIKPIFHHGLDVTEVPGIAGWLDKLLATAFEETLVEPNMLVVDVEKFASRTTDCWYTMDEKRPIAFAKVEIIEAVDMKMGDISGLADPYVKGQLGPYRFTTKIQKRTLAPKWQEEYKIPISSWEAPNELNIQVCDKDRMFNDTLGECWINIEEFRGGQKHEKWLTLQNVRTGKLHLAITVLEGSNKEPSTDKSANNGQSDEVEATDSGSPRSGLLDQNLSDDDEDATAEGGQRKLQPIKGGDWHSETRSGEDAAHPCSPLSGGSPCSNGSNNDKDEDGNARLHGRDMIKKGLRKISNKFHSSDKADEDGSTLKKDDEAHAGKGHLKEKAKSILKLFGDSPRPGTSRKDHANTKE